MIILWELIATIYDYWAIADKSKKNNDNGLDELQVVLLENKIVCN